MVEFIRDIDMSILFFIYDHIRNSVLNPIMVFITTLGDAGMIWIATAVVFLFFKKTRNCGIAMGIALILGLIFGNGIIKNLVARIRPFEYYETIKEAGAASIDILIKKPGEFSFPSGHTQSSFAAATVIFLFNKKWGIPALILATLIGFSRLYMFVHYPTDIIGGIVFGVIWATMAVNIVKIVNTRMSKS